jgi:hypothetical protein
MGIRERVATLEHQAPASTSAPCRCGVVGGIVNVSDPEPKPIRCARCGGWQSVLRVSEEIVEKPEDGRT